MSLLESDPNVANANFFFVWMCLDVFGCFHDVSKTCLTVDTVGVQYFSVVGSDVVSESKSCIWMYSEKLM